MGVGEVNLNGKSASHHAKRSDFERKGVPFNGFCAKVWCDALLSDKLLAGHSVGWRHLWSSLSNGQLPILWNDRWIARRADFLWRARSAVKMGEEGNADVLLVHAPSSEVTYMDGGNGKDRFLVMHNDFIIVGPANDPAGIKDLGPKDAFVAIYNAGAPFVSRGDDSGTHKKELSFWTKAELDPKGRAWYLETGQGMGASLTVAFEKGAYILTDRATYLANKDKLQLEILLEGNNALLNVYHLITVNPDKWPKANYEGAMAFAKFITDTATRLTVYPFC